MEIIPYEQAQTQSWSGGTTTELFIYPRHASYKKQDFDFRISTATVEVPSSTFTKLPGVRRILMVLQGTLELEHKGHHSTILEKFERDEFSGDWETTSGGIAEDFNLMIRAADLNGYIRHIQLSKKSTIQLHTEKHGFIYIYRGTLTLNETIPLTAGDSIYFTAADELKLAGISNAVIIYVILE